MRQKVRSVGRESRNEIDEPSVARTRNRSVGLSEEAESGDKAGIERVLWVISGFAIT